MRNLDTPLKEIFCDNCRRTVKPKYQVRLSPDECGQKTDVIGWGCPLCYCDNFTPDDLSILDAAFIENI
jgi:RNase P subunit RPR2